MRHTDLAYDLQVVEGLVARVLEAVEADHVAELLLERACQFSRQGGHRGARQAACQSARDCSLAKRKKKRETTTTAEMHGELGLTLSFRRPCAQVPSGKKGSLGGGGKRLDGPLMPPKLGSEAYMCVTCVRCSALANASHALVLISKFSPT